MKSLAIKYRPTAWADVVEQGSTSIILQKQIETGEFKHAYLFCGPAGCGKTTCARIFANGLNKGQGNPIELDAASNNSVDDVREIILQAKTQSLNSEFKVFILDECHALSNSAWQAMLKLIEEPPAKSIFIFCTTDPQKIPRTILSRVQRFDFQRISQQGIVDRLHAILEQEEYKFKDATTDEAIEYIAKLANGGMRDAITYLDKCLAYSPELKLADVVSVLGAVNYSDMFQLTDSFLCKDKAAIIQRIETFEQSGKDLRQLMTEYLKFTLDSLKYCLGCDWKFISIPAIPEYKEELKSYGEYEINQLYKLVDMCLAILNDVRYSAIPRFIIEARFLLCLEG